MNANKYFKIGVFILLEALFSSCDNQRALNNEFRQKYEKRINEYKVLNFRDPIERKKIIEISGKLYKITAIKPSYKLNFSPSYSEENKTNDVEKWNKWIEQNESSITNQMKDSL